MAKTRRGPTKDQIAAVLRKLNLRREAMNILQLEKECYRASEVIDLLDRIDFHGDRLGFLMQIGYTENDAILQTLTKAGKL